MKGRGVSPRKMTRCIIVSKISLPNTSYISNFYDALVRLTNTTLFNSTNGALDSSGYGGQAAAARGGDAMRRASLFFI